jgi:hypothetical protein
MPPTTASTGLPQSIVPFPKETNTEEEEENASSGSIFKLQVVLLALVVRVLVVMMVGRGRIRAIPACGENAAANAGSSSSKKQK